MKIVRTFAAAAVAAVAATAIALATTISAGTTLNAVMDTALNSGTAYVGERFTMHLTAPYPSYSLQGAYLRGRVLQVTHAKQGVKPQLQLAISQLVLRDGTVADIDGQVTAMQQKKSESNLGHSALTALGGMLVGNVIGKTIFHTSMGGAVGLAGGALYGLNAKTNFTVPAGSRASVQMIHTVVIRRQSHR